MVRKAFAVAAVGALAIAVVRGQDAGRGASLFADACASCHGVDGRGLNGPNLIGIWASGATDDSVFQTIRRGVTGSMPASRATDADVRAIIAHLRALAAPAATAASAAPAFATVTTRDGRTFRGEKRNEDAFSIQLDVDGRLVGFAKSNPVAPPPAPAPVTSRDLRDGLKDPTRWLSFHGDYSGRRHSPLTAITPDNVGRLAAEWTFQTGTMTRGRGFEATPLAFDGVLYVTGSNDFAWALDARTGRPFWSYRRELPNDLTYGAQAPVNRGFGLLGDRLFMATLDAHLLAFDRRTGKILWDVVLADYKAGYSATLAPLVIPAAGALEGSRSGKVIVGISGGEYPTRGFLDAYDPATGARIWRFYTVPVPGEPGSDTWPDLPETLARGGGATWMTGTYDPDLDVLYWGTGNPNPDYYGESRKGDNLFTNSLIAVDAATGKPKWHYQFTPHDTHDWDSNQIPVLADLTIAGASRRVVMLANRNGFFYVLDRRDGRLISGKPFTDTTWAREIGKDGRPIVLNDGTKDCVPDMWGGTNFNPPSFDASIGLFFVNVRETCAVFVPQKPVPTPGPLRQNFGGTVRIDRDKQYGALRAIDAATGVRKWEFRYPSPTMAGVLSTASGLVFAGDNEGNLTAFDARTGANLWRYPTGTPIWGAAPMTFMLDNRQHILIASGTTLVSFALPDR